MYKRVLTPLDGSKLAEHVLPYAVVLAKGFGARIELIRAFKPTSEEIEDPAHHHYSHQVDANLRSQATDYLRRVTSGIAPQGIEVTSTVHAGDPATWIVEEAQQEPDTLIAMATHGRSGITRWRLGSVTDKVLHATTAPVLVARSREDDPAESPVEFKTVLAPLDGSEFAEQSLSHVAELAKTLHLRVVLLRVERNADEDKAEAEEYLEKTQGWLRQQGAPHTEQRVVAGQPAESIIDVAYNIRDNLVVMTSHGRGGLGRWMLGSVTSRVVQNSRDPILIIRAKE